MDIINSMDSLVNVSFINKLGFAVEIDWGIIGPLENILIAAQLMVQNFLWDTAAFAVLNIELIFRVIELYILAEPLTN